MEYRDKTGQLKHGRYAEYGMDLYFEQGHYHRVDGPAITVRDREYFFLHGHEYELDDFIKNAPITDEHKVLLKLRYE